MNTRMHTASPQRPRKYATAQEVKQRVGILDAAQMLGLAAERKGGKHFCRCFCARREEDHTPSVFLDERDDHFHCFIGGCGAHGDIFGMVCLKNGWNVKHDEDYYRAKDELCRHFGIWPSSVSQDASRNAWAPQSLSKSPKDYGESKVVSAETRHVLNAATEHYAERLWQEETALAYVRKRGLSDDTIRRLKLGYASGNTLARAMFNQGVPLEKLLEIGLYTPRGYEKLAGYVILPVLEGDDTVFMQGRSPQKHPSQKHDSLPEGLAHKLPMAMGYPRLGSIVAEGSFDFAAPIEWGLDVDYGIVGLLGTGQNLALSLRAVWLASPVILALDQDCAGKRVALQMQESLAEQGKRVLILVDVDRVQAAQKFVAACEAGKQPTNSGTEKRLKSAREHLELVQTIAMRNCLVEVQWGGRKDLNDLLMWGRAGWAAFQPVLIAAGKAE